jgi:hypothetical protein
MHTLRVNVGSLVCLLACFCDRTDGAEGGPGKQSGRSVWFLGCASAGMGAADGQNVGKSQSIQSSEHDNYDAETPPAHTPAAHRGPVHHVHHDMRQVRRLQADGQHIDRRPPQLRTRFACMAAKTATHAHNDRNLATVSSGPPPNEGSLSSQSAHTVG